jgi:GGDEF domain-containing protein
VQAAQRSGGQLVLLAVTIENIGPLETESGFSSADCAIKETAEPVTGSFRPTDMVARLNGANFVVLAADAA